jgi:hypothetical protein
VFSAFLFNNSPHATTNFAPAPASFFTRQNGTGSNPSVRASLNFTNLGSFANPANRLVYRASTNSLLFDSPTGIISGIPTNSGTFDVNVSVTGKGGTNTRLIRINIQP